jgi:hypothetical protein
MVLESGVVLVYIADKAEDLSLVADVNRICRPDIVLECYGDDGWYQQEKLERVQLRHNALKPKIGTFIICRETVPELAASDLENDIKTITASFDITKLEPIVSTLTKHWQDE